MSEKTFHLEIVTPTALKFEGAVTIVVLPGTEGEMGLLAGHAPLLALLDPGVTRYCSKGRDFVLATGEGFVKVAENRVVVMVDSAEGADEIDAASLVGAGEGGTLGPERLRAQRLLARAREQVASRG